MRKLKNYIGWNSAKAYIGLIRMLFIWKILCMRTSAVCKKIVYINVEFENFW